ncbi:MAG TPA: class I fructose-bisphosphate aldolase [Nocardioides sp.]|uniref:class I fructose-bisphosphate aldolase n=1 Tax=Nocardioides sp. TaxID=35761 RepID=UPI002B868B5D|nr:class I fructose-bisphosphate aldolase [Nocardioides sp.]HTW13862.1 class I fructose-bisphosphate aldolase [Nocardioides sp.]
MPSRTLTHLIATAAALVAPGHGLLAADESLPTMSRRLASVGVDSTEALRREYREILFTTPGLANYISGVILFDESIRHRLSDGTPVPEALDSAGLLPGIKVDRGTRLLANFGDEVITEGLDGLRERLQEYADLGARFAKWRAVLRIGPSMPSPACVDAHAQGLARYAALAQETGLVPVVEPEVLMDGPHSIDRCASVTRTVLRATYEQLLRHDVVLPATVLKPNMVLPGTQSPDQVEDDTIAARTLEVLRDCVPASVPGIAFLSGGQTPQQATARLDRLNRREPQPWQLTFSFGRALQAPVLRAWSGDRNNRDAAQAALIRRAALTAAARRGAYQPSMELGSGVAAAPGDDPRGAA